MKRRNKCLKYDTEIAGVFFTFLLILCIIHIIITDILTIMWISLNTIRGTDVLEL